MLLTVVFFSYVDNDSSSDRWVSGGGRIFGQSKYDGLLLLPVLFDLISFILSLFGEKGLLVEHTYSSGRGVLKPWNQAI